MFTSFTIQTATKILPTVIKKFEFALAKKNEVAKTEQELQVSLSTITNFEEYVTLKQKLNTTILQFYQAIEDLENTGVVIKSLEEGLLDFPSIHFISNQVLKACITNIGDPTTIPYLRSFIGCMNLRGFVKALWFKIP